MNLRTAAAAVAVAVLALSGCAGGNDAPKPKPSAVFSSATSSPSVDQSAAGAACKDAWRQAVEDGAIDDGSVSAENHPAECEGVKRSAQLGADAIREHTQENRQRLEACEDDPSCTEFPRP